jgi:hypothetical protein
LISGGGVLKTLDGHGGGLIGGGGRVVVSGMGSRWNSTFLAIGVGNFPNVSRKDPRSRSSSPRSNRKGQ